MVLLLLISHTEPLKLPYERQAREQQCGTVHVSIQNAHSLLGAELLYCAVRRTSTRGLR